ncbi:hypothetical protein GCM10011575_42090 [Microlunatus endophyticus]|uniref:Dynamin N-terminal domain-containing protein n=1 Tax=Microlunatus endophyticus TaxID=1716077 RepID=A0A917SFM4_9ACTN|nr:hypothetical protein GCM10011575_42090 [Microlunatus endophyticus]
MVNALFGADLLPTGALPLTSVATVVTAGGPIEARVHFRDGRDLPISLDQVAGLVSEQGNPGNVKHVDQVMIVAPSRFLPDETEVVDTPGTGSIHVANSDESSRARGLMDVAVLMVAADPPVSAAEIALMVEAAQTASRTVVLINKADLVSTSDLPAIRSFTERALNRAIGKPTPIFVTSLRTGDGLAAFADWLAGQLRRHGSSDAVDSTARALRRAADVVLDELSIEDRLLRDEADRTAGAVRELNDVLGRAWRSAMAATDALRGEALRLRRRLDADHDKQAAWALARARHRLDEAGDPRESPEQDAERRRSRMISDVREQAAAWFDDMAAQLAGALQASGDEAIARLRDDLAAARRTSRELLGLELTEPAQPARTDLPRLPFLEMLPASDWQELISVAVLRHLPASIRRSRLRRALDSWAETALNQPLGRSRSALQAWLESSTRLIEHDLTAVWEEQMAALERATAAVQRLGEQTKPERTNELEKLAGRAAIIRNLMTQLETLPRNDDPTP